MIDAHLYPLILINMVHWDHKDLRPTGQPNKILIFTLPNLMY